MYHRTWPIGVALGQLELLPHLSQENLDFLCAPSQAASEDRKRKGLDAFNHGRLLKLTCFL
jgi:hypothetical protein